MAEAKAADMDIAQVRSIASLDEIYPFLKQASLGSGWKRPEPSIWANPSKSPKKAFLPAQWRATEARAALESAARLNVDTVMAERRNLIMINPLEGNIYATVRTLISAYQLVLAHETARSHRHSPNALRLVLEASPKAYTVVNGKNIPMVPGDVLLTPNWAWHGHDNQSDQDAFWIDFLDVPTVQLLEPMFLEMYEEAHGDWLEKTAEVDAQSPFCFSWSVDRERLAKQPESQPGWRELELGPPKLDTIMLTRWGLEAGVTAKPVVSTANSVVAVIEGEGTAVIDGKTFHWTRGDVHAVPAWKPYTFTAKTQASLLRVSDEAMLRRLNWYRTA